LPPPSFAEIRARKLLCSFCSDDDRELLFSLSAKIHTRNGSADGRRSRAVQPVGGGVRASSNNREVEVARQDGEGGGGEILP
jgi:hypothetical protein